MIQRLQKSLKENDEGFTLIELLVVIVIIGILAAIAIPIFLNQRQKAVDSSIESDLKAAATVQETIYTDDQAYATDATALEAAGFKSSKGNDIVVTKSTADGYCITGHNDAGSGEDYVYDSGAGGLFKESELPAGGVCP